MKKYLFSLALMAMAQGALACVPGMPGGPNGDPLCMGPIFEQQRLQQQRQQSYYNQSYSAPAPERKAWGAIAVSKADATHLGIATNRWYKWKAKRDALKDCGKDCIVDFTFYNKYVAIWFSDTIGGYTTQDSPDQAMSDALQVCKENHLQNCRIYKVISSFPN